MKVFIEKDKKEIEINFCGSAGSLLKKLKINHISVLVVKESELVSEDAKLGNNDKIKILSVVSGG